MVQIGGYLTPAEHAEFKRYAAKFQLKDSSLANLLIVRELSLHRLDCLKRSFSLGHLKERSRITAHQADPAMKQAFEAHVALAGVSSDQAASLIFRAELTEHWLAKSISRTVESI